MLRHAPGLYSSTSALDCFLIMALSVWPSSSTIITTNNNIDTLDMVLSLLYGWVLTPERVDFA